jgi:pimeloyl-ACP methyl ester carboxylesterase
MGTAMAQMLLPPDQCWIAPSRFGYLGSPILGDGGPAAQADLFVALLDRLNINRVVCFAFSSGGPSALQFAARHPTRCASLILLEAVTFSTSNRSAWVDMGFRVLLSSNPLYWLAIHLSRSHMLRLMGVPADVQAHLTPDERRWMAVYLRTMWPVDVRKAGLLNDMARRPYPTDYSQITVPTLIMHAVNDPLVTHDQGQYAARCIPHARFLTLTGGGHFMAGQHDLIRSEVQRLLESVEVSAQCHMGGSVARS